jgi:glyoxylase-like metal-dependent hydrolase (beta-lactamase superfamily II)
LRGPRHDFEPQPDEPQSLHLLEHTVEHPRFRPAMHPRIYGIPGAEAARKRLPLTVILRQPKNGIDDDDVLQPHVAALARQIRLYQRELFSSDFHGDALLKSPDIGRRLELLSVYSVNNGVIINKTRGGVMKFSMALMIRRATVLLAMMLVGGGAYAQALPASQSCTRTVEVPPPSPAQQAALARTFRVPPRTPTPAEMPRLVKVKDDVYMIQNVNNTLADIIRFGGNVTIYLTDDGVILFDSKNAQMHDDIVSKVRSLTDKPIRYVVLTHSHADHSGGSKKMEEMGATVIISREDWQLMAKAHMPGLPQITYHGQMDMHLGGKQVLLDEFCGHTRGDTVAYLPGPRVLIAGDLITVPDTIPEIVGYGDGGNWTDLGLALDSLAKIDFDVMIPGHGPALTKAQFLKQRDKVIAIRERVRALTRQGRSRDEIAKALLKEFNYGGGLATGQIAPMMQELRQP